MDQPAPKPFRFRFGLRAIFLGLTVAALAFSYWGVRQRAAAQKRLAAERIAIRHDAAIEQLVKNVTSPPAGCRPMGAFNEAAKLRDLRGLDSLTEQVTRHVLEHGHVNVQSVTRVNLSFNGTRPDPSQAVSELETHYSSGLGALGFKRRALSHGEKSSSSLWSARGSDLTLLIDVDLWPPGDGADIRLVFINSEALTD